MGAIVCVRVSMCACGCMCVWVLRCVDACVRVCVGGGSMCVGAGVWVRVWVLLCGCVCGACVSVLRFFGPVFVGDCMGVWYV